MHMTTSIREVADVTVVDISGRILLGDESAALRDMVRHLSSSSPLKLLKAYPHRISTPKVVPASSQSCSS
jgi:hypothetical protein